MAWRDDVEICGSVTDKTLHPTCWRVRVSATNLAGAGQQENRNTESANDPHTVCSRTYTCALDHRRNTCVLAPRPLTHSWIVSNASFARLRHRTICALLKMQERSRVGYTAHGFLRVAIHTWHYGFRQIAEDVTQDKISTFRHFLSHRNRHREKQRER